MTPSAKQSLVDMAPKYILEQVQNILSYLPVSLAISYEIFFSLAI